MGIKGIHLDMTPEIAAECVRLFKLHKSVNHTVFMLNYQYAIDDVCQAIIAYIEKLERETNELAQLRKAAGGRPYGTPPVELLMGPCEHGVLGGWTNGSCPSCDELRLAGHPPPMRTTQRMPRRTGVHDPGNASCPRNADPRNECCDC